MLSSKYTFYAFAYLGLILFFDIFTRWLRRRWGCDAPDVASESRLARLGGRVVDLVLPVICVVALIAGSWLAAAHDAQFSLHHIVQTLGSRVVTDYWTTNNVAVTYESRPFYSLAGVEFRRVPVTNELWHIWGVFK